MDAQPNGEPEGGAEGGQGPIPQNETPLFIMEAVGTIVSAVQDYGWFLLLGAVCLIYVCVKLKPYLDERQRQQEDRDYYKKYDAGKVLQQQAAMDAARQRLQVIHDEQAAAFAVKQKERDEKKRQDKIDDWDRQQKGLGHRLNAKSQDEASAGSSGTNPKPKPKKPLRDNSFNALSGSGGGAAYRPPRRGGAGGG